MSKSNKTVFITGGDKKFLPLIEVFLKSMKKSSNIPVIVYGFDCTPDFKIDGVITKRINIHNKTKLGRDTSLYYAKIHASIDVLKEDYDSFIWIDADCIVTKNIDNVLNYTKNLQNYPLFMRYKDDDLSHWKIYGDGTKKTAGHGEEVGNVYDIKRNNNFTIATGLYIFNKHSKWFFEKMLKENDYLINVDSRQLVDDLAFSEERLANMFMWKYNFKEHLPITWISNADETNNNLDNDNKHLNKFDETLQLDRLLGIMYEDNSLKFPTNQSKILFYHGSKTPAIMEKIYNKLFTPTKLMIVAHPDDESIFGGGMLLNEHGWRVISMTGASDKIRSIEFTNAMKFAGVAEYKLYDFVDSLTIPFDESSATEIIQQEINAHDYTKIVTHNNVGEYGHTQHISLHKIVKQIVKDKLYTFAIGDDIDRKLLNHKKELLSLYNRPTELPGFYSYVAKESIKSEEFNIDEFLSEFPAILTDKSNRAEFYRYIIPKLIAKNRPILVVETGATSEEIETNPCAFTYVMAKLIKNHTGGELITIDNDIENLNKCKVLTKEFSNVINYIHSDSIKYLQDMTDEFVNEVDLFFFDSFDIIIPDPLPSAEHHLNELLAVYDRINDNTIISIDDNWFPGTDIDWHWFASGTSDIVETIACKTEDKIIGKGSLINEFLHKNNWSRNKDLDLQGLRNVFLYEREKEHITTKAKKTVIHAHTSYVGTTGYNRHAQKFFRKLNELVDVRIRNFTVSDNFTPTDEDKKMLVSHTLWDDDERKDYPFFSTYNFSDKNVINLVLNETHHYYFYDNYEGPKIAYNVWESTRQPSYFFDKLKEFDQVWVPTKWQRDCTIEQGMPANKVKVVPEAVNGNIFNPQEFDKSFSPYIDGRFKFIIFGRWDYRKSTEEMVRAFLDTFRHDEPVDLIISVDNPYNVDGQESTEGRLKHYGQNQFL